MIKPISNKKAAMQMSVGTIVTIVLLMSVLVLGLVLVRSIFTTSTNAVDQIDAQVQNQINKLFTKEGKEFIIFPASRDVTVKKGDNPAGFAFSVKNNEVESKTYSYTIEAQDVSDCGSSFTEDIADGYLLPKEGSFSVGPGKNLEPAELIKFNVPDSAPPCTIMYRITITEGGETFKSATVFVNIE